MCYFFTTSDRPDRSFLLEGLDRSGQNICSRSLHDLQQLMLPGEPGLNPHESTVAHVSWLGAVSIDVQTHALPLVTAGEALDDLDHDLSVGRDLKQ